jgi:hypothetical protein
VTKVSTTALTVVLKASASTPRPTSVSSHYTGGGGSGSGGGGGGVRAVVLEMERVEVVLVALGDRLGGRLEPTLQRECAGFTAPDLPHASTSASTIDTVQMVLGQAYAELANTVTVEVEGLSAHCTALLPANPNNSNSNSQSNRHATWQQHQQQHHNQHPHPHPQHQPSGGLHDKTVLLRATVYGALAC